MSLAYWLVFRNHTVYIVLLLLLSLNIPEFMLCVLIVHFYYCVELHCVNIPQFIHFLLGIFIINTLAYLLVIFLRIFILFPFYIIWTLYILSCDLFLSLMRSCEHIPIPVNILLWCKLKWLHSISSYSYNILSSPPIVEYLYFLYSFYYKLYDVHILRISNSPLKNLF